MQENTTKIRTSPIMWTAPLLAKIKPVAKRPVFADYCKPRRFFIVCVSAGQPKKAPESGFSLRLEGVFETVIL